MQKCYNISIIGKVQDISFRSLIEDIGRFLGLKGYVFNDIDGSVKMVCCGENSAISNFLKEIGIRGEQRGVVIEDIAKEEIPFRIFLPEKFSKLYTDELVDIGRKLDKGNERLDEISIKMSTVDGRLSKIGEDTSTLPAIKDLLGSFVIEQREHNTRMDEHNLRLEKILEKLAER